MAYKTFSPGAIQGSCPILFCWFCRQISTSGQLPFYSPSGNQLNTWVNSAPLCFEHRLVSTKAMTMSTEYRLLNTQCWILLNDYQISKSTDNWQVSAKNSQFQWLLGVGIKYWELRASIKECIKPHVLSTEDKVLNTHCQVPSTKYKVLSNSSREFAIQAEGNFGPFWLLCCEFMHLLVFLQATVV